MDTAKLVLTDGSVFTGLGSCDLSAPMEAAVNAFEAGYTPAELRGALCYPSRRPRATTADLLTRLYGVSIIAPVRGYPRRTV
jgi:hypothetical protein